MKLFDPMLLPQKPLAKEDLRFECTYMIQPKYDGIRLGIFHDGQIRTRSDKEIPNKTLEECICNIYLASPWSGWNLDCEVLLWNKTLQWWEPFNVTQSIVMSKFGFDTYAADVWRVIIFDQYVEGLAFHERWGELLEQSVQPFANRMCPSHTQLVHYRQDVSTAAENLIRDGHEGAIVRNASSTYKCGRATYKEHRIFKWVDWLRDEAQIVGYEEACTNLDTTTYKLDNLIPSNKLGALIVDHPKFGVFNIGTGFSEGERQQLWSIRDSIKGKKAMFKYRPGHIKIAPCPAVFISIRMEE